MKQHIRDIERAFGGKLHCNRKMKLAVCRVLLKFPPKIVRHITKHCWFVGSTEDAWAFTMRGDELVGKHLIFLSDELLGESKQQIEYTIAHEVGHVILHHQNSIFVTQTKKEIEKQEKEAHEFAMLYTQMI